MPDPAELLSTARLLCDGRVPPADADLRRAISTAYYAVFHKVIRTAVARFAGPAKEDTAAYALLYRSFDHSQMKEVCKKLNKLTLGEEYKRKLGRQSVSSKMRDFANAFSELQELRHEADYDPTASFERSVVVDIITLAESAMDDFAQAASQEQTDILALMMVKSRA